MADNRFYWPFLMGLLAGFWCKTTAQTPEPLPLQDQWAYTFETALPDTDEPSFDLEGDWAALADLLVSPLNINTVSVEALERLPFLSAHQRQAIVMHRFQYGLYLDVLELQTVLDKPTLDQLRPFVYCDKTAAEWALPLAKWWSAGQWSVLNRWESRLEKAAGFDKSPTNGGFTGSRPRHYLNMRYRLNHRLSYGLTLEKDAGEKAQNGFASAHIMVADVSKKWRQIVIGDYALCWGQGLILDNGFGLGKSSAVLNIHKNMPPIRPYTSSNEALFLRGMALKYGFSPHTEGVLAVSHRRRAGNLRPLDGDQMGVSSLPLTGLHRTASELADRRTVAETVVAGRLQHLIKRGQWAFQGVFYHYDRPIAPTPSAYNQAYFRGQNLLNMSFDYKYRTRYGTFFGEIAYSTNGGWAALNGWQWTWNKHWSLAALHRCITPQYQVLQAQAFAESSRLNDESGWYVGLDFHSGRKWRLGLYTDVWRHQNWRFRTYAPSEGYECFLKWSFESRKKPFFVQIRWKTKGENAPTDLLPQQLIAVVWPKNRLQGRLQGQWPLTPTVSWRWRADVSMVHTPLQTRWGSALMHDLIFHPTNSRFELNGRWALFDTEGFDTAIYAYENDVRNSFTVLPYYDKGQRFYINMTYALTKRWTCEGRLSRTLWENKTEIGSGNDLIRAAHRTDFKVQIRRVFSK